MAKDQILEIKVPKLAKVQKSLGNMHHKAPSLISRSINRTITHVKTLVAQEAQETYIVKPRSVIKTLRIKKSTTATMSGEVISSSNERLRLIGFKVNPAKQRPASPPKFCKSQVKVRTGLKPLTGSPDRSAGFVAKMKSGHTGVFQRQTKKRLPIAELTSLSIPSMLGSREPAKRIQKDGSDFLHRTLEHEIKRILEMNK